MTRLARSLALGSVMLCSTTASTLSSDRPTVLLVVGAFGQAEFGSNFVRQAELWTQTCEQAGATAIRLGLDDDPKLTDHDRLQQVLSAQPTNQAEALWLVLIGHGTFDGKVAKFNLRGPDVSAEELADWLWPFERPLVVINTASASTPFMGKLAGTNRVIITATRSGHEQDFTRFGGYLAESISNLQSDLDRDGQTSLLEAFVSASQRVAEFYQTEGRLATEHALLDDNGDGYGTPADWFRGVRATKKPQAGASLDGARAHQFHLIRSSAEEALPPPVRAHRDALELEVVRLRESKPDLAEAEYLDRLEALLLQLARLYETNSSAP